MPKEITHWLIAREAAKISDNPSLQSALSSYKHLYYLGAVLPDTPYYYLGNKGACLRRGIEAFHGDQVNSFAPFSQIAKQPSDLTFSEELSITFGIISHIITDSIFHPMVYYFSGEEKGKESKKATARHRSVETAIDLYFQKQENLPGDFLFKYYTTLTTPQKIYTSSLLNTLCHLDNNQEGLQRPQKALQYHCLYQYLFSKPAFEKLLSLYNKVFPHTADHILPLFYSYRGKKSSHFGSEIIIYRHPATGDRLTTSLQKLKQDAVQETTKIFNSIKTTVDKQAFYETIASLSGPNLITGLRSNKLASLKYFSDTITP